MNGTSETRGEMARGGRVRRGTPTVLLLDEEFQEKCSYCSPGSPSHLGDNMKANNLLA